MPPYKYTVGEQVEFLPSSTDHNVPRGTYTIVRRLPFEAGNCAYRVKHSRDGHERVIPENQLGRQ
ncbi:MAG: hypothetical protein ABI369_14690 [Acetobacteraceae bacterium]